MRNGYLVSLFARIDMFSWRNADKKLSALGVAAGYLLAVIVDPFITVLRLNIETWAQQRGFDKLYKLIQVPEWLTMIWSLLTGGFGLGFVLGALIFAFWDTVAAWWLGGVPLFRQAQILKINELYNEAIKQRLRIRNIDEDEFDYDTEFNVLREWKSRLLPVARRLDANYVINLESLGDYKGRFSKRPDQNSSEFTQKNHMESMWNEYVDRVKQFVNDVKTMPSVH